MRFVVAIFIFFSASLTLQAQRATRVGYIDTEYILSKIATYNEMRARIQLQAAQWSTEIDSMQQQLDRHKRELMSKHVLLPLSVIEDRERDILALEQQLLQYQQDRFGPKGDFITQEMNVVKPLQDLIFEAVQEIAELRKFDLIVDKSSEVVFLYADSQFDLSDQVLLKLERDSEVKLTGEKGETALRAASQANSSSRPAATEADEERKKALDRIESERQQRRKAYISKREEVLKARAAREKEMEAQKTKTNDSIK